ncbi:MAG: NAD-dependent epimerase/dehydratase family protein [Blastomonas sp.]|nr:NAD-dependent epimerase/dehydratase family protein [Blastomonas sp.]
MLSRYKTVINCVGSSQGSYQQLRKINVDIPLGLVNAAIQADIKHFIQISSFSIFGRAEHIDRDTSLNARGAYGQSKLEAELSLRSLAHGCLKFTTLRLPMMYGIGLSKLDRLISVLSRLGFLVHLPDDLCRSVIHYDSAARVVQYIADVEVPGEVFAADPVPFSYHLLQTAFAQATGVKWPSIIIPQFASSAMRLFAPSLSASLFADSYLAERDNFALTAGVGTTLCADLCQMVIRHQKGKS